MFRIRRWRPRHGTAVAYLALFFALSGTAVAATGGNFTLGKSNSESSSSSLSNTNAKGGAALKLHTKKSSTPNLAVSNDAKIAHLNADLLDGLQGKELQPRARLINASTTSPNTVAAGSSGKYTFSMQCSATGFAKFKITGPGTGGGTTSRSANNGVANTFVSAPQPLGGGGYVAIADTDEQVSATFYFQSGKKVTQVELLLTASNGGLFENCAVVGVATPVH